MRSIEGRLSKLENRFGLAQNQTLCRFIVSEAGRDFGGAEDTYLQILDEAGFTSANGFTIIDLTRIPHGLSAEDAEKFVREHGAKICGPRGAPNPAERSVKLDEDASGMITIRLSRMGGVQGQGNQHEDNHQQTAPAGNCSYSR
jgi:hypothetical protein